MRGYFLQEYLLQKQLRDEYKPIDYLREFQWEKLKRLLVHAYNNVPFYRRRFEAIGATPRDIKEPGDFRCFPVLTREEILESTVEMLAFPGAELKKGKTGGSTGHPLTYYYHPDFKKLKNSLKKRGETWLGAEKLNPKAIIWGVTGKTDFPENSSLFERFTKKNYHYAFQIINKESLEKLYRGVQIIKPKVIWGYPSLLKNFSEFLLEERLFLAQTPKVILATAETLTDDCRKMIEDGLRVPVFNGYGSHENGFMAFECRERQGLHLFIDHVFLEIIKQGTPAQPGEAGGIVVTDLDNYAMPFIRYRNDDVGAWSEKECPCGRNLPLLERIYGRTSDFVVDKNGVLYPGINLMRSLRPVAANGHIRQFQIIQPEKGRIDLLAVPGASVNQSADELLLRDALKEEFSQAMDIRIYWVEDIPSEPSGKTRFIKSQAPNEQFR